MNDPHGSSFGENRDLVRKDEWGNTFRPPAVLQPFKIERACDPKVCTNHVTVNFSIETDVITNPLAAFQAMLQGQEPPTSKQWVPVLRVLSSYN